MDDAGLENSSDSRPVRGVSQESVHQGSVGIPYPGMHHQASLLVDDHNVLVFIDHIQRDGFVRKWIGGGEGRDLDFVYFSL